MEPPTDLIGAGWAFPPKRDWYGRVALTQGDAEIEQAIHIILETPIGQRVMRPRFGCRIHELLFAPINASTLTAAEHYVADALAYWEPRINVIAVVAHAIPRYQGFMQIEIQYRIKAIHDERSLVYPFYTIPDEDE